MQNILLNAAFFNLSIDNKYFISLLLLYFSIFMLRFFKFLSITSYKSQFVSGYPKIIAESDSELPFFLSRDLYYIFKRVKSLA